MFPNIAGSQAAFSFGSAVPVTLTGSTAEVEVARISLPPYPLGTRGFLRFSSFCGTTNSGNTKTMRLRLGSLAGIQIGAGASTTIGWIFNHWAGFVRPDGFIGADWLTASSSSAGTAVNRVNDWSTDTDILITLQLQSAAESYTLFGWLFEGFKL